MNTNGFRMGRRALYAGASSLIMSGILAASGSADAQQQTTDQAIELDELEEIVVTGSRIRRDEFSSPAPLQTFSIDAARQVGISSISDLLQRTTVANGQQINTDLNTNAGNSNASEPPPLGGVGSANIGLRGLEAARTLILINNRRLGASGVRGAPAQPDLNLLPLNMVERIEVITEGASSVYGADAVAGVVNVILRDDFEGMEATFNTEIPLDGGGFVKQFSFITGNRTDNSSFVLAGEFYERNRLEVSKRRDCVESIVMDADTGERLESFCSLGFFDNMVFAPNTPRPIDPETGEPLSSLFLFATPGSTDIGVDGFSSALALPEPSGMGRDCRRSDERCRGLGPIPFYSGQFDRLSGDLVQPTTRFSLVTNATYQPDWFGGGEEFYFEGYYLNRHAFVRGATEQIFPTIPGEIRQLDADGDVIVDANGDPILVDNPLNPFDEDAVPILTLDDLRQDRDVELQHFRFVGGFRGDFTNSALAERNWYYDFFVTYDRGAGSVEQPQMSESELILATQTLAIDADGNLTCGIPITDTFGFITQRECVPVNFFAPSVFGGSEETTGTFATEEERDFLIGSRVNHTVVEQFMVGGYLSGDLFDLPAGTVGTAFGGEFRRDSINSFADFISSKSLNSGENPLAEGATEGTRDIFDLYAEVNVPLISDKPFFEYVAAEGAVRYTDEENFGSEITTRARATWRLNDWIQASGSYGTSFRAPNLRETFLAEQFQGISSSADPCGVPPDANDSGVYNPAQDNRSQVLLDNCVQSGADPTQLGLVANINIPVIISGNAQDLNPETSRSWTATVQFSPQLSNEFTLDIAVSFFDIELENAIRSVSAGTILTRCFETEPNLASPFCDRVTRTLTGNPNFDFVTEVDASFVNVGQERSQGFDVNGRFQTTIDDWFEGPLNVAWGGAITFQTERKERIFNDEPFEDLLGDFGFPKRRLNSTLSLNYDRIEFIWESRHQSGGQTDDDERLANDCDVVDDALNRVGPNMVLPICSAPGAWYHDTSVTYNMDRFVFTAGLRNVFDKKPPLVSLAAGSNRANRVTSSGYDQFGRTFFMNVSSRF